MSTYIIAGTLIGSAVGYALGLLALVVLDRQDGARQSIPAAVGVGRSTRSTNQPPAQSDRGLARTVAASPMAPVAPVLDDAFLTRSARELDDRQADLPAQRSDGLTAVTVTGPSIGTQSVKIPKSFAQLTVGSSTNADLQVSESSVAGTHLILQRSGDRWSVCRSAGAPEAYLTGRPIGTTPERLRNAELVQFGDATLEIRLEAS